MKGVLYFVVIVMLASCQYSAFEELDLTDCSISDLTLQAIEITNADCGSENGSINVSSTGGLPPYSFSLNGATSQLGTEFSNLSAANYLITVNDENGCQKSIEAVVQNNDGVNAEVSSTEAGCEVDQGTITVFASNGLEPYMYQIDAGSFQTSNQFTGVSPGIHTIVVNDVNNCSISFQERVSSGVSFTGSISNIISSNCAISGCHAGSQPPDFRIFTNIQANAASIRSRTQSRSMPKNGSLSQEQIDLIACWVDDGALDN